MRWVIIHDAAVLNVCAKQVPIEIAACLHTRQDGLTPTIVWPSLILVDVIHGPEI